ncbi:unnamed protein product [Allacma fusca]|uniref:Chitin-binding type-4 domain-containing protein n=1 Tax=Allacma fusca TaxID=39272 RepID=A0A8J2LTE2_9HEXA|nr:unnamed protein product [Allacma fusca]
MPKLQYQNSWDASAPNINLELGFRDAEIAEHLRHESSAHGRLMDPPARNSQWRFGYPNPVNYNDNELFCGGFTTQWEINGGKCGVCGDAWNLPEPRPHEDGGEYGKGLITRRYAAGQDVDIEVELTANHMGNFKFKLCPYNGNIKKLTQECFDQYPLYLVNPNGSLSEDFHISHKRAKIKSDTYYLTVRLPLYVTCTHCVVQWTYRAGNGWGICPDGSGALGCGAQESFINCADVSITSNTAIGFGPSVAAPSNPSVSHQHVSSRLSHNNPYLIYYRDFSKKGTPIVPLVVRSQVCLATGPFKEVPGMDRWCQKNCMRYPPSCPTDKCRCLKDCNALPPFNKIRGSDQYCLDKCLKCSLTWRGQVCSLRSKFEDNPNVLRVSFQQTKSVFWKEDDQNGQVSLKLKVCITKKGDQMPSTPGIRRINSPALVRDSVYNLRGNKASRGWKSGH